MEDFSVNFKPTLKSRISLLRRIGEMSRAVSGIILTLMILTSMLTLVLNIRAVRAWNGTIYIRADGSIDPSDAPLITFDNITYTLIDNITSAGYGIIVSRDNIVIDGEGHTILGPGRQAFIGIYLYEKSNITLKNIEIRNFYTGIALYHSSNNSIFKNKINENFIGISLSVYSNNNNIYWNNITGNTENGIYISGTSNSNNTISWNNVNNNRGGVVLHYSFESLVSYNNIEHNYYGIVSYYSSRNNFYGNNIIANYYGVYIEEHSSNSKFYHNNIVANEFQAVVHIPYLPGDFWDDGYPSGGNYWSDYTDVDQYSGPNQDQPGSDGIWDHPYVINENNIDHYPLVNPWTPTPSVQTWLFDSDFQYNLDDDYGTVEGTGHLSGTATLTAGTLSIEGQITINGPLPSAIPEVYLVSTDGPDKELAKQSVDISRFSYWQIGPNTYNFTGQIPNVIQPINNGHYEVEAIITYKGAKYAFFINTASLINSHYFPLTTTILSLKELKENIEDLIEDCQLKMEIIRTHLLNVADSGVCFLKSVEEDKRGIIFDTFATVFSIVWTGFTTDAAKLIHFKHASMLSIMDWITLQSKYPFIASVLEKLEQEGILKAYKVLSREELKALGEVMLREMFVKLSSEERQTFLENLDNQFRNDIENDIEALNNLKQEVFNVLPSLTPEETELYLEEVKDLKRANNLLSTIYLEKSSLIKTIATIKHDDEHDWSLKAAKILWSGSVSVLAVAAQLATLGPIAPVTIKAAEGLRQQFFENQYALSVDAQMAGLALETLDEGFTLSATIYQNTYQALLDIRGKVKPCIPKMNISAISNKKILKITTPPGYGNIFMVAGEEYCSEVLLKTEQICNEVIPMLFILYKKPYVSFRLFPGVERKYEDLIPVEKIAEIETGYVKILYEEPPDLGKTIEFLLIGKVCNKTYTLDWRAVPWEPTTITEVEGEGYFWPFITSVLDRKNYEQLSVYYDEQTGQIVQRPTQVIKLEIPIHSPEVRVYDSKGRVTGIINEEIKEEIPGSIYNKENRIVIILNASDTYSYEVAGVKEETYELLVVSVENGKATTFNATNIPISIRAIHDYTINWAALSSDEGGVIVQVDSDGDGIFERIFTSDSELDQDEFVLAAIKFYTIWDGVNYPVYISSNSTISNFTFNQSQKMISFNVKGATNARGYCNVTIPKALLKGEPWTVRLNGTDWTFTTTQNETHSFLYFTYTHSSTYEVTIQGTWAIPEFPSTTILLTFILNTLTAIILLRKKRKAKGCIKL
jgi:parallel beta-helix repeat protein